MGLGHTHLNPVRTELAKHHGSETLGEGFEQPVVMGMQIIDKPLPHDAVIDRVVDSIRGTGRQVFASRGQVDHHRLRMMQVVIMDFDDGFAAKTLNEDGVGGVHGGLGVSPALKVRLLNRVTARTKSSSKCCWRLRLTTPQCCAALLGG